MSEQLGGLPYPMVTDDDPHNPLTKYRQQLHPLAQLTDQLWPHPQMPTTGTMPNPMMMPTSASHGAAGGGGMTPEMYQARMPPMGAQPGVATAPETPTPLPQQPEGGAPQAPLSAMMSGVAARGRAPLTAEDMQSMTPAQIEAAVSHYPTTAPPRPLMLGSIADAPAGTWSQRSRRASTAQALRQASALAPEVPSYEELAQQGRLEEPSAGEPGETPETPGSLLRNSIEPIRSRDQDRVSTRIPSEAAQKKAGSNAHTVKDSSVGFPAYKAGTEAYAKNAKLIKEHYPGFQQLRTDDPNVIHRKFVRHIADNLKFLYNHMLEDPNWGPERIERAKEWYHGANRIVHRWAGQYGFTPMQVAAAIASMSPQKDWFQNVDLTKRVMDIHHLHMGARGPTGEQMANMHDFAQRYIGGLEAAHAKKMAKRRSAEEGTEPLTEVEEEEMSPQVIDRLRGLAEKFRTTPYHQLANNWERAVYARFFDEGNNHRMYRVVTPEGEFGDYVLNPTREVRSKKTGNLLRTEGGDPRKMAWGSFKEIEKAMTALHDASPETISRVLGGNHKIRSFHNNMSAPDSDFGDITGDTHHIAASLFRPLGSGTMEVGHGLGTGSGTKGIPGAANNAVLGNRGLYPLYHEGARIAAEELSHQHQRKILGREVQSVTWEGIRSLFTPAMRRDTDFMREVANVWHNKGPYRGWTQEQRLRKIVQMAGGLRKPTWDGGEDYGGSE
jgi:hypothetical protein